MDEQREATVMRVQAGKRYLSSAELRAQQPATVPRRSEGQRECGHAGAGRAQAARKVAAEKGGWGDRLARLELVLAQRDRAAVVARVEVAGIRDKDAALLACMPCSGKRKRKAEMTDRGRQDKTERAEDVSTAEVRTVK